jgi:hypothetical protein
VETIWQEDFESALVNTYIFGGDGTVTNVGGNNMYCADSQSYLILPILPRNRPEFKYVESFSLLWTFYSYDTEGFETYGLATFIQDDNEGSTVSFPTGTLLPL